MRISQLALTVSVLLGSLVVSNTARAECAAPGLAFAPHTGATLPPDPIVHVFLPSWQARDSPRLQVRSGDRDLAFEATLVTATDAFIAYRLVVATDDASEIEIGREGRSSPDAVFEIDPDWMGPSARSVRVLDTTHVEDHWTCSFTDAHFLTLTDAPAYRVQWSEDGETKVAIFPRDTHDFFARGDAAPDTNVGQVGLGHVSCFGRTAPSELDLSTVTVAGVWPDGLAETEAETEPEPNANEIAAVDCGLAYAVEHGAERVETPTEDDRFPVTFLLALVAGLLGLLAGARRALRG